MQIISSKMQGSKTFQIACRVSASLLVLALGFPASASGPDQSADTTLHPVKRFKRWIQVGQASWYGLKFQGHRTATGETFDMNQLTCAHRSLPLGSWVRVTNLKNKKSIVVRVNDRGPALDNRIVDLSYAAAQAVGLRGVGKVRLDAMPVGDPELTQALLAQMQMPVVTPFPYPMLAQ
ncbi:MAG TPA: septal ring lytic transglycosylase RlpA family protein [Granulicella sp.]|jgi:rare lipoprotein A|nr:septal ring lytic transglycosylase RlpA family protein [Granulicella sp.]